jgi:hypothetical protein
MIMDIEKVSAGVFILSIARPEDFEEVDGELVLTRIFEGRMRLTFSDNRHVVIDYKYPIDSGDFGVGEEWWKTAGPDILTDSTLLEKRR